MTDETGHHKAPEWLTIRRGKAPLLVSLPHTGTVIPDEFMDDLVSPWLARKDTDWWIDQLYAFVATLDATIIHTAISRSVIDVNRDPSGLSLYPGQATTELCPTTTFDGEPLYRADKLPDIISISRRRKHYFAPYHSAIEQELGRLLAMHPKVILYDCHSIRSVIPRLFDGELPHFNIGTNAGTSCDPALAGSIEAICDASTFDRVTNGRFKGGYITRQYGSPETGIHAIQMELACRGYLHEPIGPVNETNWPAPYDAHHAAAMRAVLNDLLQACLDFAQTA